MQVTTQFLEAAQRAGIARTQTMRIVQVIGDMNCGFRSEAQKVTKLEQEIARLGLRDQVAVVDTGRQYTDGQPIYEVQVKGA